MVKCLHIARLFIFFASFFYIQRLYHISRVFRAHINGDVEIVNFLLSKFYFVTYVTKWIDWILKRTGILTRNVESVECTENIYQKIYWKGTHKLKCINYLFYIHLIREGIHCRYLLNVCNCEILYITKSTYCWPYQIVL